MYFAWQSMIHVASKLNYKNLNEEVLKHFARLQSKDEQVCGRLLILSVIGSTGYIGRVVIICVQTVVA